MIGEVDMLKSKNELIEHYVKNKYTPTQKEIEQIIRNNIVN